MFTTRNAVLFLSAALTLLSLTANAQAYQCKTAPEVISGSAFLQSVAVQKGKTNWSAIVRNEHGLPWSVYQIAEDASIDCSKNGSKYECVVSAVPCLQVIF